MTSDRPRGPHLVGEAAVVIFLLLVYDHIRALAPAREGAALHAGRQLLSIESVMSIDVERWFNANLARHHEWELLASLFYQVAYVAVALAVLCFLWWWHPEKYRDARNALVAINAGGLIVFWLVPVAPPRLLPGAGFVDSGVVTGMAQSVSTVSPNQFAAMPSLHIAWAVWVAMQLMRTLRSRTTRCLAVSYPFLTCVVILATGNHYVLDAIAGAVLAVVLVRSAPALSWWSVKVRRSSKSTRQDILVPEH